MVLADSLSFINRGNYTIMSFVIGFIIGLIPGIGILGPIVGGFLYSYFAIFYNEIPRDQMEAAKKGAIMGLALAVVGVIIFGLEALLWTPAYPFMMPGAVVYSPLALAVFFIEGLIIGAILGGIGGFISFYVE